MKIRKLNRDSNARVALFRGQMASLIDKEEIQTTAAKARAVRSLFEKMITKARSGSLNARRLVQADIQDAGLVAKLFSEIAPRYAGVNGGYTKLTLVGNRKGDNAPIVKLALTKKSVSTKKVSSGKAQIDPERAKRVEGKAGTAPLTARAGKVTAPMVAKPTGAAKALLNKSAASRKAGER